MPWSVELQELRDRLVVRLIDRCREEAGRARKITGETDACRDLGICEEDLDDVQIDAAASVGLRLPFRGEPLIVPWHGPGPNCSLEHLAAWIAVNGRPLTDTETW